MNPWFDLTRLDVEDLASAWRFARPFPHVVLDDFLLPDALPALRRGVAQEPHWPERGEIVEAMTSMPQPAGRELRAFTEWFGGAATREALASVTGQPTEQIELRSYVYLAGSYLLPHTDYRRGEAAGAGRRLAFALYLSPAGAFAGGELDLYACTVEAGEITRTEIARTIEPRPGRLALFDVSEVSLHRVREVTAGARVSLAGWFL